jgi:hypothetical protein
MGDLKEKSTHSQLRHQMELSDELHALAALPPQKEDQVPSGQVARRAVDQVWARRQNKSMSLLGIDFSIILQSLNIPM